MPAKRPIDVDGSDAVSKVLLNLLNTFPGLSEVQRIQFSTVPEDGGIGFFPTSGAVFLKNREDITGHVKQVCQYPFTIVYRSAARSEAQRLQIKELLDALGRWLERQPVTLNGVEHKLESYPPLESGQREIQSIVRTNPAHLNQAYPAGLEDWAMSGVLTYKNEFDKSNK